jgi:two-component system, response regulator PdtaR
MFLICSYSPEPYPNAALLLVTIPSSALLWWRLLHKTGEIDVRILIAEDEAIIAMYIGMTLREAGHQVMGSVVRLDECLKLAEQQVPELALIDIDLGSGGSGIGVARVLLDRWGIMSIFVSAQQLEARKNMDAAIGCLPLLFQTIDMKRNSHS